MRPAHDIYAEHNPAFCAYAIVAFIKAYTEVEPVGPDLPIVYLALPIALSGDLAVTFDGTNKNTGLLEWLGRTPQMSVGLVERVNAGLEIVGAAVRFGCFTKALQLSPEGRLGLGPKKPRQSPLSDLDALTLSSIRRASRLGSWFATAGSTRNIFGILGLTV
jgi:hypothetical protein